MTRVSLTGDYFQMRKSGYTKDINIEAHRAGHKGYIKWDDGSISYLPTRAIAKKELAKRRGENTNAFYFMQEYGL